MTHAAQCSVSPILTSQFDLITISVPKKNKSARGSTAAGILSSPQQQTITVSVADIKSIPQAIIAQCSNAWSQNNTTVTGVCNQILASTDVNNYQNIKWENATPIQAVVATKATTLNTAGLHFISAPAAQTVTVANPSSHQPSGVVPGTAMVIHGHPYDKRKPGGGGTIIETFKCEVCNQIFASMNSLQNHIAQVHEVGISNQRKRKYNSSTLHCEYKYSGLSLADSLSATSLNSATVAAAAAAGQPPVASSSPQAATTPQFATAIIATGGNSNQNTAILNNTPAFIQNPGSLSITNLQNGAAISNHNNKDVFVQNLPNGPGIILTKAGNNSGKVRKEKRRNWQCEICHNRFSRKDHLAKHVSAVHEKIRPFECMQCGQKFSQKHHLRAHMLARHEDDKNAAKAFACQQCPKRFTRNDHLERHVESVHEKRKAFECAVCSHQFARKHHLSKHILAVHAKVKPYGCNQCDQSFLQRHHLGMISHKMSLITIFGQKHFRQKFHQKFDIFHEKISTASDFGSYLATAIHI